MDIENRLWGAQRITARHSLINASLLFQFSAVCTMTTEGLREEKITSGYAK